MNIPPLISRTPPPLPDDDDDDDDEEFGSYVISNIIDNGSSDIFRSINRETLSSAYDFIQPVSVGPVKDSPEKINFYKNGVDSPTTSSTKDHLPDVIPDCEPIVPSSTSLCDGIVFNGKDLPSDASVSSPTKPDCCEPSKGVVGSAPEQLGNESGSFVGTVNLTGAVTVTVEKQVSSNEICTDALLANQTTASLELPEVCLDPEDASAKEVPSNPDIDDLRSFDLKNPTNQEQYFDENVDVDITEINDLPPTESLNVVRSQAAPPDEISAISDSSFAFEKPIDQNFSNTNGDDRNGEMKEFASSTCSSPDLKPQSYETPAVPDIDSFTDSDFRVDDKSTISDTDDFTSFAFEKPLDQNSGETGGKVDAGLSDLAEVPLSSIIPPDHASAVVDFTNSNYRFDDKSTISDTDEFASFAFEKPIDQHFGGTLGKSAARLGNIAEVPSSATKPPDDSTVPDVDEFTSFAFEKPVAHEDGFCDAGFSSTVDFEADEFSEFADFQTSSEADFVFQEAAPVAECQMEDAVPAEYVEEFDVALVGNIDNNTIWCRLRYLEDTPALKYQWLSSSSNHKLLSALKIDSRNIFCGPWSRSAKILGSDSRAGPHHDATGAPSAGHHERCHLHEASVDPHAKPTVPDAHFDWEGSGLVNPLFSSAKDDEILHCDIGGIIGNQMSREASDILKSLPHLSYMTKTYLVFKPLPVSL